MVLWMSSKDRISIKTNQMNLSLTRVIISCAKSRARSPFIKHERPFIAVAASYIDGLLRSLKYILIRCNDKQKETS